MKLRSMIALAGACAFVATGCMAKVDEKPDTVVTPGSPDVHVDTPDVNVTQPAPDVNVHTTTPPSGGGTSTVTTGQ